MNHKIYQKISEYLAAKQAAWLVTVVDVSGSAPGQVGFKMLIDSQGEIFGTVGGGAVEMSVIKKVLLEKPRKALFWHFDLNENAGSSINQMSDKKDKDHGFTAIKTGMLCGGRQDVFVEPLFSSSELYVIGGGHCAQALSELASKCDFTVTVMDNRAEFVTESYHPYAVKLICAPYNEISKHLKFAAESTYIVVMTHGHAHDELVLRQVVNENYKYLGVIGSKHKSRALQEHLIKDGYDKQVLQRVFSPIGLDIGSQTPHEIAVSIVAQLIEVKNKSA